MTTFDEVIAILDEVLQLGGRSRQFDRSTALLGDVPEFDSMAVVTLVTALEEHFNIRVDDDEIGAETFETVGALCDFVESKLAEA